MIDLTVPGFNKKAMLFTFCYIISAAVFCQQKIFYINTFGAKADSKTNNAVSIQKAIDKASQQGGKVVVPEGYFVTGPIQLKSGVELHLEEGAVLLASIHRNDYGAGEASALLSTKNEKNIAITGKGIIDGRGQELVKDVFKQLREGNIQDDQWKIKRPTEKNRPKIIEFTNCTLVTVKGITVKNGSGWIQDYTGCNNVLIDSINVQSTEYWNNDGIDIVNSKNVKITNCIVDVADDAICLKSEGSAGWCENIYVSDCTLRSSASGFKLGTGSFGGFRKITVRNLQVYDTYRSAIALEAVDGGFIEDVDIRNVTAKNTGNAIFIRLGHRNKDENYSTIKNVFISNVKAEIPAGKPDIGYPFEGPLVKFPHNIFPASIAGLPGHYVDNVTLENIEIEYEGGAKKEVASVELDSLQRVPENMAGYPEFSMFGELPCWGLYVRHAQGLKLKNIQLSYKDEDFRPAIIFDNVKELTIDSLRVPTAKQLPVIVLNNVTGEQLKNIELPVEKSKGIEVRNTK